MKTIAGYHLIQPGDLTWRLSNLMQIPNADFLERTGSENLGARLWRLPPQSANTLHQHVRAEEFYFVLEGVGRLRVGGQTLTVAKYGGVLVGPGELRQVFNDTDAEVLWLIVGGPEELEFLPGAAAPPDLSLIIMRCLAKSADDRFQTGGDLADALLALLATSGATGAELRPAWFARRSPVSPL
jgi:mannose-6-phosphate isomerase-like protein (cupin superfamily)